MQHNAPLLLTLSQLFPQSQDLLVADNRWHGADPLKNGMLMGEVIDVPLEVLIGVPGPHNNCANNLNYSIKFIISSVKI